MVPFPFVHRSTDYFISVIYTVEGLNLKLLDQTLLQIWLASLANLQSINQSHKKSIDPTMNQLIDDLLKYRSFYLTFSDLFTGSSYSFLRWPTVAIKN